MPGTSSFCIMSRTADARFDSQALIASATSAPTAGECGLPLTVTRQTAGRRAA